MVDRRSPERGQSATDNGQRTKDHGPMNLVFCGTSQFAVPTLEKLIREHFTLDLVLTRPDEPSGRGYERKPSPVKQVAEEAGLIVFQPAKLNDIVAQRFLSQFRPDAIVVVAYGHIIPPWMIELPRLGCVNLHASLLPKYRGAAPIPWAIIRGEHSTGVTTMKIDSGLDTGDILLQREVETREDETVEVLSERLSTLGAELVLETLRRLERGDIKPHPQDHSLATLAPRLRKEDGRIDWSLTAEEIARRVRGLRPWPGAYTTFRGKNLHLWTAQAAPPRVVGSQTRQAQNAEEPGTLVVEGGRLWVLCGKGTLLEVKELQLESRKRMAARDFLNGVRPESGERLTSESTKSTSQG